MLHRDTEKTFWNDKNIRGYFESKPADPRIASFMERYTEEHGQIDALDLGCGGGRHSELLARLGHRTKSVDVNTGMLETTLDRLSAQGLHSEVSYGSIIDLPFEDEAFDIVVTTGVLHQANTVDDYLDAMAELSRVVKPGGYVLLNVFTNRVWDETYTTVSEDGYSVITQEGLPQTLLPKETFDVFMRAGGFAIIDDQGEDIKQENTGPRAIYRAFFQKQHDSQF